MADQSPLVLPDTWTILYVSLASARASAVAAGNRPMPKAPHAPQTEKEVVATQWLSWVLHGVGIAIDASASAVALPPATTSSKLINQTLLQLVESLTSEWQPAPSIKTDASVEPTKSNRSSLSSLLHSVSALAAQQNLASIPITQQHIAHAFEKLKFKVLNHSGRLTVEWYPRITSTLTEQQLRRDTVCSTCIVNEK